MRLYNSPHLLLRMDAAGIGEDDMTFAKGGLNLGTRTDPAAQHLLGQ